MTIALTTKEAADIANLVAVTEKAQGYAKASTADNTKRAYRAAWSDFTSWCEANGLDAHSPEPSTVGMYLADRADTLKVATLRLRLAAISQAFKTMGQRLDTSDPAIRRVMGGIVRTKGVATTKKEAVTDAILRDCIRAYASGETLKAKRDRAVLAVGFFAALRRSELSAIDIEHVRFTSEGVVLTLPRRKTDQDGEGTTIGLPVKADSVIDPVEAVKSWIDAAGVTSGPLFRSVTKGDKPTDQRLGDKDVARIIKNAVEAAGYNAAIFGGHSLRSGFITTAARKGISERIIANQSGHRSINVLRGYVRRAGVFVENAAALI